MSVGVNDVLRAVDWGNLNDQKCWLQQQDTAEAEGLIHLIDNLQDAVVNDGIATEDEVFFS